MGDSGVLGSDGSERPFVLYRGVNLLFPFADLDRNPRVGVVGTLEHNPWLEVETIVLLLVQEAEARVRRMPIEPDGEGLAEIQRRIDPY